MPKDIEVNLRLQGNVAIWPSGLEQSEAAALCNSLEWEPDRAIQITHPYPDDEFDVEQLSSQELEDLSTFLGTLSPQDFDTVASLIETCRPQEPHALESRGNEEFNEAVEIAASLIEASDYPHTWRDEHVELFTAIRRARDELAAFFERLAVEESGYVSTCRNLVHALDQADVPSHVTVVLLSHLLHPYPLLPER